MTEEDKARAIRVARTIASDIAQYNEDKILKGLQQDTLFQLLEDQIEEGREFYRSRVGTELDAATNYFDRAIVDMILKPRGHLKMPIW
ncbi:MAG: hypothetical protein RL653_3776 [Pseudomonadota bacterium]|jgi:hypothetical protein